LRISLPFSLKFFVLFIKYKSVLPFYPIYTPVKDELSPQEGNLSFGFVLMSQKSVGNMVFSTELAEYGCRRWPYNGSMGEVSSRLGMAFNLEYGFIALLVIGVVEEF
jgi:hypothetical protein